MSDLHVERLFYRIASGPNIDLSKAPRAAWQILGNGFHVTLDGDEMIAEPQAHYASPDDARAVLDPFLRTWEIQAALAVSTPSIQFEYQRADVVDRDPTPGVVSAPLNINQNAFATVSVRAVVGLATFPGPSPTSRANDATERMYLRLRDVWADDKHLPAEGYYILDEVKRRFTNANGAAKALNINLPVMKKIGEMTSLAGGRRARKAVGATRPLTSKEVTWLKAALRVLVLRSLEYDANPGGALSPLTMADLPAM